jgi:hypothetical protein
MPKTLDAFLSCVRCGRATLHLFHERRPPAKGPGPASEGPVFVDLVYVCDVCETERVWGNEPVMADGWASEREAREEHAVLVHGMRTIECRACRGVGFGCPECNESGETWHWDKPDPCGPDCPLERPEGE